MQKASVMAYFMALLQHLPGETVENNTKPGMC
jgi:hypothetical protein